MGSTGCSVQDADCYHIQALQNSVEQLEVRLNVAESGRSTAEQHAAELQQQLSREQEAHKTREALLLHRLAQQESVLAAAAVHLGPLESQANPVSPVATPRLQEQDMQLQEGV